MRRSRAVTGSRPGTSSTPWVRYGAAGRGAKRIFWPRAIGAAWRWHSLMGSAPSPFRPSVAESTVTRSSRRRRSPCAKWVRWPASSSRSSSPASVKTSTPRTAACWRRGNGGRVTLRMTLNVIDAHAVKPFEDRVVLPAQEERRRSAGRGVSLRLALPLARNDEGPRFEVLADEEIEEHFAHALPALL